MSENSEKISKTIELIEKAKHIGMVLPPETGVDELVSAEVFWRALENQGKQIGLLAPLEADKPLLGLAGLGIKNLTNSSTLPREFVISLDTSRAPISEMRYEKEGELLNIVLSPASSRVKEDAISFREGKTLCDLIVALGVENIENVETKNVEPSLFSQTPIINIDVAEKNKLYGEANLVDPGKISIAEIVYEFLTVFEGRPLGKDEATLLLAGLVEKSNGFDPSVTNADLALAFSELLRLGADYNLTRSIAKEGVSTGLLQLFGRATVRSKFDEKRGVLWSFLTPEDFEKTGRSPKDSSPVIERLDHLFGPHRLTALLFQEKKEYPVQAMLSGETRTLEAIHAREPGSFQSPHLLLSTPFQSFRDAEEYLSSLLSGVL